MVITMLEAAVEADRTDDMERIYRRETADIPPAIVETFLTRDGSDPSVFRIVTVWASAEALEEVRSAPEKPKGVQMFEEAGASPTLTVLDVVVHRRSQ